MVIASTIVYHSRKNLVRESLKPMAAKVGPSHKPERRHRYVVKSNSDIFETITELAGISAVVVGIGNAKGQGLSLARFFRNRSTMNDASAGEKQ